jgi:hypothetical protein
MILQGSENVAETVLKNCIEIKWRKNYASSGPLPIVANAATQSSFGHYSICIFQVVINLHLIPIKERPSQRTSHSSSRNMKKHQGGPEPGIAER